MGAPSLIAEQAQLIISRQNALISHHNNHAEGCTGTDGGTTQGSGASVAPNVDIDVAAGLVIIEGTAYSVAATADADSDAGSGIDFNATTGKSAIGVLVAFDDDGSLGWMCVFAAVADTADAAAPTAAEIDTGVGDDDWVAVTEVTLVRTGDTAITIAFDDTVRYSAAYAKDDAGLLTMPSLDATSA